MPKQSLASIAKGVRTAMKKHSPEILTGIGIAGMITTTVMAVKATPKALILLEEKKDELDTDRLEPKDIIKTAWPCYIPAAVVGAISVFCLIGASSTNLRRNAALATAYTLSESTLKEYQEKVVETIGEKKEQSIRDSVSKDKMVKNPVREVILTESGGNTICYDVLSGRYFKSDRDKITRVMNELNRQMRDEMYVTLNDFYYELGLDGTKMGDTPTNKKDYASKRLNYPLEEGATDAWNKLMSTIYSEEERTKIEWAIGSIVCGESKKLQKFMVLYGAAGTGKSTVLNIVQQLFEGYYSVFDAKALGSSSNSFALEAFKTNPLVAIQHDGDLSRIEDNTRLNSLVSHELMTVRPYVSGKRCGLYCSLCYSREVL